MGRTLEQWVEYIQTLHPRTIDLTLGRVAQVWERFKPEYLPQVIAVAGTNGKGSSVSMLESVFRQAGYRTGAFTSPHLVSFNERICLGNTPVSDRVLLDSFERIESLRGDVSLTFFEFNTLLALDIFCAAHLDVILLEVGMGGRLDAVNIVDNDLALITAVSIDHSAWLGNDREQIGIEKAGIIKRKGRAVLADPQVPQSVVEVAAQQQAVVVQAGQDYRLEGEGTEREGEAEFDPIRRFQAADHPLLRRFDGFSLEPAQNHVLNNTAGVIAALAMMYDQLPVEETHLREGLARLSLRGRLQLIEGPPRILLDVSHNEASVLSMLELIDSIGVRGRIHAVFGALADKDYGRAYGELKERVAVWYLCGLKGGRGQSAQALGERLFGPDSSLNERQDVYYFNTPKNAFIQSKLQAKPDDLIVIFGSFHLVGGILPHLNS